VSWPLVPISEIAKVVTGKTPSKMDDDNFGGDIPFVTPAELGKLIYVKDAPQTLSAKGAATIKLIPKDAVMVCCIGSLGKLAIAGRELATNQQINSVIFDEKKIDPKFGFYALSRLKPQMESLAPSTTVAIINKSNFEALKIPLPPLAEQKRIAAILDKADAIRRKRQQAIQLADEFLRSVFLDMFGDPVTNPKGFPVGTIRELVGSVNYGTSAKASEEYGEYPILRMGNITYGGGWDLRELKYIDISDTDKSKYLAQKGDLIFNRTNSRELVGKTAVYEGNVPMAIAGYLIRVRPNEKTNTYYLSGYLNSKHGKSTLLNMGKSIVGMANINA
jgi:type I restriction enzyme S subunit